MEFIRRPGMGFILIAAVAALGVSTAASASVVGNTVTVNLCGGSGGCWNDTWAVGSTSSWSNITANGSDWNAVINTLQASTDPSVTNNFTLTNTSASTQTYTMTTSLNTGAIGPATATSGSVGATATSNGNSAATVSTSGSTPIYTALIDGSSFQTLLYPPFSQSTPYPTGGGSLTFSSGFGLPGNTVPGPAVGSSIGIQVAFALTPGDSVGFTSNFQVQPVPVPASLILFGSGLIGLMGLVGIARRGRAPRWRG